MREIFKPVVPAGPAEPLHGVFYTITAEDVGKSHITTTVVTIHVSEFMGRVLPIDVGKRIYAALSNDKTFTVWQVENDAQRDARVDRRS